MYESAIVFICYLAAGASFLDALAILAGRLVSYVNQLIESYRYKPEF